LELAVEHPMPAVLPASTVAPRPAQQPAVEPERPGPMAPVLMATAARRESAKPTRAPSSAKRMARAPGPDEAAVPQQERRPRARVRAKGRPRRDVSREESSAAAGTAPAVDCWPPAERRLSLRLSPVRRLLVAAGTC